MIILIWELIKITHCYFNKIDSYNHLLVWRTMDWGKWIRMVDYNIAIEYWKLTALQYNHDNSKKNDVLKLEDFRRDTLEDRSF